MNYTIWCLSQLGRCLAFILIWPRDLRYRTGTSGKVNPQCSLPTEYRSFDSKYKAMLPLKFLCKVAWNLRMEAGFMQPVRGKLAPWNVVDTPTKIETPDIIRRHKIVWLAHPHHLSFVINYKTKSPKRNGLIGIRNGETSCGAWTRRICYRSKHKAQWILTLIHKMVKFAIVFN